MRTPEEILAEHHCAKSKFEHKNIIEAMTDYAKQKAEAFAEWADTNYTRMPNGLWGGNFIHNEHEKPHTTTELYTLFKTEKKDGK